MRPSLMFPLEQHVVTLTGAGERQKYGRWLRYDGVCAVYRRAVLAEEPASVQAFMARLRLRIVRTPAFPYVDVDAPHDLEHFKSLLLGGHTLWQPEYVVR